MDVLRHYAGSRGFSFKQEHLERRWVFLPQIPHSKEVHHQHLEQSEFTGQAYANTLKAYHQLGITWL